MITQGVPYSTRFFSIICAEWFKSGKPERLDFYLLSHMGTYPKHVQILAESSTPYVTYYLCLHVNHWPL